MNRLLVIPTLVALFSVVLIATAYATEESPTFKAKVGELKKITFKLKINAPLKQDFVYVIQVKDEEGFTKQLSWVTGSFQAGQEMQVQQSWIPEKAGKYDVEILLFRCISCIGEMPQVLTMNVNVEA
jgi:hypothetical protein